MSIEKLPSKNYRVRIRTHGVSLSRTFPTREAAKAWEKAKFTEIHEIELGISQSGKTVTHLIERYRNDVLVHQRGGESAGWVCKLLLQDPIAQVRLNELTTRHLVELRERMSGHLAPSTVRRRLGLLRRALKIAMRQWRWLQTDPGLGLEMPKPSAPRTRRVSNEELAMIADACEYDVHTRPQTSKQQTVAAFLTAIETAMRRNELVNLLWRDVNLDKRYLLLEMTKNGTRRRVALSKNAVAILNNQKGIDPDYVFSVSGMVINHHFRKTVRALGIENLVFHDSRREATTRMSKRMDVLDLAKQTGHKDMKLLLNTYYQPSPTYLAKKMDAYESRSLPPIDNADGNDKPTDLNKSRQDNQKKENSGQGDNDVGRET